MRTAGTECKDFGRLALSGHWASNWHQTGDLGALRPLVSAAGTSECPSLSIWRGRSSLDLGRVLQNLSLECQLREGTGGCEIGASNCNQTGGFGHPRVGGISVQATEAAECLCHQCVLKIIY